MSAFITTVVLIVSLGGLTYMAKDLVVKNKATRKTPKKKPKSSAKEPEELENPIAAREDILKFWTEIMNDETRDIDVRLKASELLCLFYAESPEIKNNQV